MSNKPFSADELAQLEYLANLPDDQIDTVDIPEAPEENWKYARRPNLYKPLKQPVTIRLDADVVSWFKEHAMGEPYQTEINAVLRRHVAMEEKKRS